MRPLAKDTGMLGMALFSPDSLDQRKSESMEEEDDARIKAALKYGLWQPNVEWTNPSTQLPGASSAHPSLLDLSA